MLLMPVMQQNSFTQNSFTQNSFTEESHWYSLTAAIWPNLTRVVDGQINYFVTTSLLRRYYFVRSLLCRYYLRYYVAAAWSYVRYATQDLTRANVAYMVYY
jgi:hypothetical protein